MSKENIIFEWDNDKKRNNSDLFPDIFRCLIIGESNCGKTSLLLKYLLESSPLGHESSTNLLDYNYLKIRAGPYWDKENRSWTIFGQN